MGRLGHFFALAVLAVLPLSSVVAQTCPSGPAPKVYYPCTLLNVPGYGPTCSLQYPVHFSLTDAVTNAAYTLQSCETGVTWQFANNVTFSGESIDRTFTEAGDYAVHAYIANNTGAPRDIFLPGVMVANGYVWESIPHGTEVLESAGSVTVNVHTTYSPLHISYMTDGAADPRVPPASGTLSFAAGETDKSFSIPIIDDNKYTGAMSFDVFIYGMDNGVLPGHDTRFTINVHDDENLPTIMWSAPSYSVSENVGTATLTAVRYTGDLFVSSSVNYLVYDPNLNVVGSGTLQFGPNEIGKQINVMIPNDNVWKPDRTWSAKLYSVMNGKLPNNVSELPVQLTVVDDDPRAKISVGDVSVLEGDSGTKTVDVPVTLSSVYPCLLWVDFAVGGTAAQGSDIDPITPDPTWNFPAGATQGTFKVVVRGDTTEEPDETVTVSISHLRPEPTCSPQPSQPPDIQKGMGTLTIVNDDDNSPLITRIEPSSGVTTGSTVVLQGMNFTPDCLVRFDGVLATDVHFLNSATLSAVTPPHVPGTVDVDVTCNASTSVLAGAFTYKAPQRTRAVRH